MTIGKRIFYLISGILLAFVSIVGVQISSVGAVMMDGRKAAIRAQVESAHGIVAAFAQQAEAGAITADEARRRAAEALRAMRYNGGDYVFVYSSAPGNIGRNVVHPDPKIEGTRSRDDATMKKTFVWTMIRHGQEGGGFTGTAGPASARPSPPRRSPTRSPTSPGNGSSTRPCTWTTSTPWTGRGWSPPCSG